MVKLVTKPDVKECVCPNCEQNILPIEFEIRQIENQKFKGIPVGRIPRINVRILGCPKCNILFYKEFHYKQI